MSNKIKMKIAALKAKTTAAGCTEAEALAAAELAARLMEAHGLSEAEIEYVKTRARGRKDMPKWQGQLLNIICRCTNTAPMLIEAELCEIEFAGKEHAVEIALYLRDVLTRAVSAEIRKLKAGKPYRRLRKAANKTMMVNSFAFGMVFRLERKLEALFRPTINSEERRIAERMMDKDYPEARTPKSRPANLGNTQAYAAGSRAGEAISLSHGVSSGAAAPALIGKN